MELEIVHTSRIRSQFPTAVLFSVWLAFVFFLFSFFFLSLPLFFSLFLPFSFCFKQKCFITFLADVGRLPSSLRICILQRMWCNATEKEVRRVFMYTDPARRHFTDNGSSFRLAARFEFGSLFRVLQPIPNYNTAISSRIEEGLNLVPVNFFFFFW